MKFWFFIGPMFNNSNSYGFIFSYTLLWGRLFSFFKCQTYLPRLNYGWILRIIHANGARFFFVCLYFHIGRGLYYGSYRFIHTWIVGVIILFVLIATAFLGYVLP